MSGGLLALIARDEFLLWQEFVKEQQQKKEEESKLRIITRNHIIFNELIKTVFNPCNCNCFHYY